MYQSIVEKVTGAVKRTNRTYQHSRDQPFLFELMSRWRVRTRHLHYNISKGRFLLAVSILLAWHQVIYKNDGSPRMTWKCQHVGEENQTCMLGLYCRFFSTGYNIIYCIHVEIYIRVLSVGVGWIKTHFSAFCNIWACWTEEMYQDVNFHIINIYSKPIEPIYWNRQHIDCAVLRIQASLSRS